MRRTVLCLLAIAAASLVTAQQQDTPSPANSSMATVAKDADLAGEEVGVNDVVGITVYDAPELSRTYRVDQQGNIRMPMLRQPIHAAGVLLPSLESSITTALQDGGVMVSPIVTASIVEYHSRPITVIGAVHSPTTFQVTGPVTLLDAITRAGGVAENAGTEVLISRQPANGDNSVPLARRVSVRGLLDGTDLSANISLTGGETVRVPAAGRIYIVGDVKRPGPFALSQDDSEISIMKALSIAGGLDSFASRTAYIYRSDSDGRKSEIPVNVHKILARKSPDVQLFANDMLYVPNSELSKNGWLLFQASSAALGIASFVYFITQ